ncbi:hypothetical protein CC78DRAFT_170134 [Lojkania enalia]|uniref:Uncharacterized protein n=1 Tax=Lojkania enalia TaxID=147567 RepID=A0A9P4KB28_9PLEO|nr:hypothetical protein CC78DRAFT_170134 [Didymosphaeria enalia]
MRSFKSKVLSAWAWAIPALSAAVPRAAHEHSVGQSDAVPRLLELDLQEHYAQATFNVPCAGCILGHGQENDDDSLILSFKTYSSEEPCGTSSNITLNGIYLPQEWNGDLASGSGSFTGTPDAQENAWFLQHDLDLEWESACLHSIGNTTDEQADNTAQVFTVAIKGIDGRPMEKPSGFTISFKQLSPPELLRLEVVPNRDAKKEENAQDWRAPPSHLRLIVTPTPSGHSTQGSLEDEIQELRALQAELQELHKAIKDKKQHIKSQLKKEATSFKEELQQCDGIKCIVKAIANKAHGAWRVIYITFRPHDYHHHSRPHHPEMGRPNEQDQYDRVWRPGNNKQLPEATIHTDPDSDSVQSFESFPPPPPPPPPHFGPPPPHHRPPPLHGHRRHESPLVMSLSIVVGVLCCGCLFAVIRNCCCSLRSRTERAAAREERRNARAYRRAARKLAWTRWWRRNWRDEERRQDYEEKRALIQEQESVLEEAMQEEIRALREAHGVVNSLVSAEEGRMPPQAGAHMHCHCHAPHPPTPYSPISTASVYTSSSLAELPSRPLSRTNSLPDYRSDASTAPPAYEEDEDTSDVVANGFREYTPSTTSSTTSSRWTPDSSVIDVSPRPSADTLRYAETTDTGVGDAKN